MEEPVNAAASLNFGVYCGASPAATKRVDRLNRGVQALLVKRGYDNERIRWLKGDPYNPYSFALLRLGHLSRCPGPDAE